MFAAILLRPTSAFAIYSSSSSVQHGTPNSIERSVSHQLAKHRLSPPSQGETQLASRNSHLRQDSCENADSVLHAPLQTVTLCQIIAQY